MTKRTRLIAIATIAMCLAVACKHEGSQQGTMTEWTATESGEATDQTQPELVPVLQKAKPAPAPKTTSSSTKPTAQQAAQPRVQTPKGKKIYVETDGAQGRVWGYVTLDVDRGSGTIHDWDENTLAVSVVRHGNELFAVDQNSRQYVFKLKEK